MKYRSGIEWVMYFVFMIILFFVTCIVRYVLLIP